MLAAVRRLAMPAATGCTLAYLTTGCALECEAASRDTRVPLELHQLAREHRLVPCLAAGTTRSLIGQWAELCQALRDKAADKSFVLTGDDMEDIELLRSSHVFGDGWVVLQTAAFVNECIRQRVPTGTATATWLASCPELRLQRAVAAARFRAVLTTNFDLCLEDAAPGAFKPLLRSDLNSPRHCLDVLESTDGLTPLLKLHGDVTPRGQRELVMGYSGHETFAEELHPLRLALREHRLSVVFYGASLSGNANWAYILDALFSEPDCSPGAPCHFVITADPPDAEHESALWNMYRIRTVRVGDWSSAEECVRELCAASSG